MIKQTENQRQRLENFNKPVPSSPELGGIVPSLRQFERIVFLIHFSICFNQSATKKITTLSIVHNFCIWIRKTLTRQLISWRSLHTFLENSHAQPLQVRQPIRKRRDMWESTSTSSIGPCGLSLMPSLQSRYPIDMAHVLSRREHPGVGLRVSNMCTPLRPVSSRPVQKTHVVGSQLSLWQGGLVPHLRYALSASVVDWRFASLLTHEVILIVEPYAEEDLMTMLVTLSTVKCLLGHRGPVFLGSVSGWRFVWLLLSLQIESSWNLRSK